MVDLAAQMDVDEQNRLPKAEKASANAKESSVEPSIILLEKLAVKMDKLEANMAEIKANQ